MITFRGIQSGPVTFLVFKDFMIFSSTVDLGKPNGAKVLKFPLHFPSMIVWI